MLQFKNSTPFQGTIMLMPDPDGIDSLYTVVKGTFVLEDNVVIAEDQAPIVTEDQCLGEPGQSSLKVPCDLGLIKPGTDVLLLGTAYASAGKSVTSTEVSLRVGPVSKTIRIFGDRVWRSGLLRVKPSRPEPFKTMPLVWERAFGGTDLIDGDPPELRAENRNPVGIGFRVKKGRKNFAGMKLPNLEDPKQLISSWKHQPVPAAFGPILPHWEPRRSYAGTYDEDWQKHRAPYLPKDFDAPFFQLAPPDQVVPGYLQGGEEVEILGASPSGQLRFYLPEYRVQATYRLDNEEHVQPANLDTVLIEPDKSQLILLWRAVFPCDKKALKIHEVEAAITSGTLGA
jgi:hypothetical protein